MGVSGNYVSMLELGKKPPGPSLRKLFETLEQSQSHPAAATVPRVTGQTRPNHFLALLSTDTLIQNFAEVAQKLSTGETASKQYVVGNLRELLDEIEQRLETGSCGVSAAQ